MEPLDVNIRGFRSPMTYFATNTIAKEVGNA